MSDIKITTTKTDAVFRFQYYLNLPGEPLDGLPMTAISFSSQVTRVLQEADSYVLIEFTDKADPGQIRVTFSSRRFTQNLHRWGKTEEDRAGWMEYWTLDTTHSYLGRTKQNLDKMFDAPMENYPCNKIDLCIDPDNNPDLTRRTNYLLIRMNIEDRGEFSIVTDVTASNLPWEGSELVRKTASLMGAVAAIAKEEKEARDDIVERVMAESGE